MTQNCSLLQHKGNFPGKSRNKKTTQMCLKCSLRCAGASALKGHLKNNRSSPKTMVQKNLSLKSVHHTTDTFLMSMLVGSSPRRKMVLKNNNTLNWSTGAQITENMLNQSVPLYKFRSVAVLFGKLNNIIHFRYTRQLSV